MHTLGTFGVILTGFWPQILCVPYSPFLFLFLFQPCDRKTMVLVSRAVPQDGKVTALENVPYY